MIKWRWCPWSSCKTDRAQTDEMIDMVLQLDDRDHQVAELTARAEKVRLANHLAPALRHALRDTSVILLPEV